MPSIRESVHIALPYRPVVLDAFYQSVFNQRVSILVELPLVAVQLVAVRLALQPLALIKGKRQRIILDRLAFLPVKLRFHVDV